MKKVLLFISFINFIYFTYGQEIEFCEIFASSSSKKFIISSGYTVGYNQIVNSKNRLGFSFSEYFSNSPYDDIDQTTINRESLRIEEVVPRNKRFSIKADYAFRLINNPKSKLYFGPDIGLNYFVIKEKYERIANGNLVGGDFSSNYTVNNRIGIGFIMEFQLEEVIVKRISTYLSINPEFTGFEKIGTKGSPDPYFIGWLNFKFGIRYSLKNLKK